MEKAIYRRQVALLLNVLPEITKERCFALHGGTAINLFVRDMPRLSVDIDLIYVPVEDRASSLTNIRAALSRIKERIESAVANVRVTDRSDAGKLLISQFDYVVKVEVNLVGRGTLAEPVEMTLCAKAQEEFEAFCVVPVVPVGQLYGGKICAALDRQHPRDLFDVKYLFERQQGLSGEIKTGFLLALVSSERPIHEVVDPHFLDQRAALENQFAGMSDEEFTYEEFEAVRSSLLETIRRNLTDEDKRFLRGIKRLNPVWDKYDFERFPAVQWKLQNLQKLRDNNPQKYREQCESLEKALGVSGE